MLKDLKVAELREVAETFGVETDGVKTKAKLLTLLEEEGITEELYASFIEADSNSESSEVEKPKATGRIENEILVKMERANPTYEILGHRFTREHPYIAMSADDAQRLFDHDPRGFKIATPNEVKEYYS